MEQKCENCKFFVPPKAYGTESIALCRRYPPQLSKEDCYRSGFPIVTSHDWCGEWQTNIEIEDHVDWRYSEGYVPIKEDDYDRN